MIDDVRMLLAEQDETNARSNEQLWNVFAQLLVPLVILLTFVVIAEIRQYEKSRDDTNRENAALQHALEDLQNTDKAALDRRSQEQLMDAQQQKLWRALLTVIAVERSAKVLDLDYYVDHTKDVQMHGQTIDDPRFKELCRKVALDVTGEAEEKPDDHTLHLRQGYKEQKASWIYVGNLYKKVLVEADDLRDPELSDDDLKQASQDALPSGKQRAAAATDVTKRATDAVVTPANRQFILGLIADAAGKIERDAVQVQRGVVVRMFPNHLDAEGERLARAMRESTAQTGGPTAEAKAYFEYLRSRAQSALRDSNGYYFLDSTWQPLDRL